MRGDEPGRYRYRAFISYRHHQQPVFVRRLELALKQYAKPLFKPPIRIFRDENHLSPGVDLPQLIKSALDESEFLILLASPESAASVWVQDELRYWCEVLGRFDRLIVVLIAGTVATDESQQHIDWNRTTALPAMLRPFLVRVPFYIDLRWATEDSTLDISHADFKRAINFLVARLRRVDPNELSGIEVRQHRRNVRLRNGAIAVLVVLFVLAAGTASIALGLWRSAEARRQEAVIVAAAAEVDQGAVLSAVQRVAHDSALPQAFRRNVALATYDLGALYENPPEELKQGADEEASEESDGESQRQEGQTQETKAKTEEELEKEIEDEEQNDPRIDVDELYVAQDGAKLITQGWYTGVHILDVASGKLTNCPVLATRSTSVSTLPGRRPHFLLWNEEGLQVRGLEDCQGTSREKLSPAAGVDNDALFIGALESRAVLTMLGKRVRILFSPPPSLHVVGLAPTPRGEFTAVLLSNGVLSLVDAGGAPSAADVTLREGYSVTADKAWRKYLQLLPQDARVRIFNPRSGRGLARSALLGLHETADGQIQIAYAQPTMIDEEDKTVPAYIEDALLQRSVFDGCMRLEWFAAGSLYRLPIEPGCTDASEVHKVPVEGGFSSAAFCGSGYAYVTGNRDGDIRWWRPIGIREIESLALEHVERSWNDSVQTIRCTPDGVLYAGFRATGIRKFRNRFRVLTERMPAPKRDSNNQLLDKGPDNRLFPSTINWQLQTPVRGSRTLRLIGSRGRLELVGQSVPVWSRQVANTVPYRTGASVDAAVAIAIDEPRARVWAMTSNGRLHVIDLFTGAPIASLGTIYYSAAPAIDIGFSGLTLDSATGEVQFRYQHHYDLIVRASAIGES